MRASLRIRASTDVGSRLADLVHGGSLAITPAVLKRRLSDRPQGVLLRRESGRLEVAVRG